MNQNPNEPIQIYYIEFSENAELSFHLPFDIFTYTRDLKEQQINFIQGNPKKRHYKKGMRYPNLKIILEALIGPAKRYYLQDYKIKGQFIITGTNIINSLIPFQSRPVYLGTKYYKVAEAEIKLRNCKNLMFNGDTVRIIQNNKNRFEKYIQQLEDQCRWDLINKYKI